MHLFLFYVYWCLAGMYVMRVSDSLELELEPVVSTVCGHWEMNPSPLEEQAVLLATEPFVPAPIYHLVTLYIFNTCMRMLKSGALGKGCAQYKGDYMT